MMAAIQWGANRNLVSMKDGRKAAHGLLASDPGWNNHIHGMCGEMAVAKVLGVYFEPTINTFKKADIGDSVQVKTRTSHTYDLIVRRDDCDAHWFVLVTGVGFEFRVWGAILGKDARRAEYLKDHGNRERAWFVPKENLIEIAKWMKFMRDSQEVF